MNKSMNNMNCWVFLLDTVLGYRDSICRTIPGLSTAVAGMGE